MSIETWKSVADWATIVFIAFTVVSGSAALILGNRINKRQTDQVRKLEMDLAHQQERAAIAEKDLAEVKKNQGPRSIPGAISTALKQAAPGKAVLEYQEGNPETFLFASGLRMVLQQGGWDISDPVPVRAMADKNGAALAEIVFVERKVDDPSAKVLWDAFMAAGLTKLARIAGPGRPEELHIRIGPKL